MVTESHSFLADTHNWVLISTILFAFVFVKLVWSKLIGGLDQKIKTVETDIMEAETLRVEAQELLAQYKRKQQDAMNEAEAIIAHAKEHAANIKKQAKTDLKDLMVRRERQLDEKLERIEEKAMNEIRQKASAIALETAEAVLKEKTDKKAKDQILKTTTDNLDTLLH